MFFVSEGMPMKDSVRLARVNGSTNARKAIRHPPNPEMNPVVGDVTRYDIYIPAKVHPIAFDLCSSGNVSPINVFAMGFTIALPSPDKEYERSNAAKLGDIEQPSAETLYNRSPVINKDLCLKRTLSIPINSANIIAMAEETVPIWPANPTGHPKVSPMSIRSKLVTANGGCVAPLERTRAGSMSLLDEWLLTCGEVLLMLLHWTIHPYYLRFNEDQHLFL